MDKVLVQSKGGLAYTLVFVSWLAYAVISLFAPRGGNTYHLNPTNFVLLQLTVIVPVLLIWMTAIYGAVKFRAYSTIIQGSPDGHAISRLTVGLYLLIASFIIQTLLAVLDRLSVGTPMLGPAVFLHNHLPMIIALVAILFIYFGSKQLVAVVNAKVKVLELVAVIAGFAVAASWLGWYLYAHFSHSVTSGVPNFTLPGHWPFFTMFLPYVFAWLLSLLSIVNIVNYTRNVKGSIYRGGLKYAATGILITITFGVMVQALTFLANAFSKMHLNSVLAIVYGILIFYAVGFVLIAVGARKLARIEVVK